MKNISVLAGLLFAAANAVAIDATEPQFATRAGAAKQEPSKPAQLNSFNVQGCFDDFGELEFMGTPDWNSKSKCAELTCRAKNYAVAATSGGNECYCGHKYPSSKNRVDDSKCNVGCTGYDIEACGGIGAWTVYNTGMTLNVATSGDAPKSKGGNDTGPATTTVVSNPIIVTEPSDSEKKGGSNVGAIAGGVVVAVVVVASSITGFLFYMRRKRNREIEEEHRRNAAVNSFISGKAPSSSGMSITDARLDPVMAQRRLSDGSIADNQDYSRKILRVTNA